MCFFNPGCNRFANWLVSNLLKNPVIKEAFTSRLGFERISCNDTLRISVSEIDVYGYTVFLKFPTLYDGGAFTEISWINLISFGNL